MDAHPRRKYLCPVPPIPPPTPIAPVERSALAAVARTVVPHAFADAARGERLVDRVAADIAALHPRKRRELLLGLGLFGSWFGAVIVGCVPRRFSRQPERVQARILERWLTSRIPLLRTVGQALRRLILFTEYTSPEAQHEVGYHGPYFTRGPAVPWEGALPGTPSDDEPIARAPLPSSAHLPPALPAAIAPLELPPMLTAPGLAHPDRLSAGVIVIGTGAGGAVAAARLAEAGHDVLMLESGALVTGEELDECEGALFAKLYADRGQRTSDDLSLMMVQGAAVGGGTTVNWMIMLRTPDWVLDEWSTYHGTEGMRPADLAPVFERIEREVHARTVPDDAHSPNNRIILDGARQLGWSAFSGRINAKQCVRAGFCGYGCRYGAKQGGLQTFLPRAQVAGARLLTHAKAARIEVVERGGSFPRKRVTFLHAPPGEVARELTAEAPVVIVAGGAVETPALLQRSRMGGGGTGRFLRVHPVSGLFGLYDREMYGAGGIPLSAVCDQFLRMDRGYGAWIECPPLHAGLGAASLPGFGATHRGIMTQFPNLGSLIVLVRDGAERGHSDGEVTARADGSIGIRYRLNPRDAKHLEAGLVAAAQLHFAAGAREVRSGHVRPVTLRSPRDLDALRGRAMGPNQIALFTAHVNGTARMGADRATAGTDPHGEVYGGPGVFVTDGSLLPTALGVNPQETIMAVSSIIAERIASRRRPG